MNKKFTYTDIQNTFEKALSSPNGIKLTCGSYQEAIMLRARFNAFRKQNRKANAEIYPPDHEMHGNSAYDVLVLKIPPKNSADSNILYITPHTISALIEEIP